MSENKNKYIKNEIDPDIQLIDKVLNGEPEVFELLINKYHRSIFNTAYRYVGDYHEAEDLTQEIFVKTFQNLKKFQGRSKFFTWLFSIAMNHLRSRRKTIFKFIRSLVENVDFTPDLRESDVNVHKEVEGRELMKEVEKGILELPEKYREVIILRDINEMSYKDIALITEMNIESVKTRIHRGRSILSSNLKKRGF